ncbi:uncharacterized protein LOC125584047 [Brassica napus]|uniref:uncharacterized protein LOC125584047 n=1 Tax=Brassica napus TaxID=3708 RepID=UPI0020792BB9|nr:uncharacterized protein LOC125584047 [Brassica napus]XP_048607795.1 uncharacterized protein LOC125584047 [Brassica napus]
MVSNGTLASPSSQSDKLQDPPPMALDSSSAPLGVELPILRGCDTDIVAPPCTEAQASQIISASHLPTVEANVTSGSTTSNQFVPSLGSWEKPLIFVPPTTPSVPSTPTEFDKALVGNQLASLWPILNDGIVNKQDKNKHPNRSLQVPLEKLPLPELKADGSLRFPWAARLGPQSRNLFRATSPTYRLDGTPEVTIPSKVLRLGPENKDEYLIGKFHRCSLPPGGLVHAVVNKIWGRSCKISCKKISDSSYMFHIPHQSTRQWIIQRGVWHIDDCLLFVLPWTPEGSFKIPEVSTLPVWVTLKDIPDCCYSRLGISHIASGLGEPILTQKPRLDPTNLGETKVLVEMELDKDFPKLIALDDKQGNIFLVKVEYTWIPSTCDRCGCLGHKSKRCLQPPKTPEDKTLSSNSVASSVDVPVVDIDIILHQNESAVPSPSPSTQKVVTEQESLPATNLACEVPKICNQFSALDVLPVSSESEETITEKAATNSGLGLAQDQETPFVAPNVSTESPGNNVAAHNSILSTRIQQGIQTTPPSLITSTPTLADFQSAQAATPSMESSPSTKLINNEDQNTYVVDPSTTTSDVHVFESPSRFSALGDVDGAENESLSSLGLTRGGRETRPPIKFQDLEWKTVQGRGKHGRRGRGSKH